LQNSGRMKLPHTIPKGDSKLGLDGLLDKRGKGRKGKSKITEEMWQTFLSYYLDEAQHPIQKCYEYTRLYFPACSRPTRAAM